MLTGRGPRVVRRAAGAARCCRSRRCRFTTPAAHADPAVFDGKEIKDLCTISAAASRCPVFPPPPGLLNPGALAAAGPEGVAQSMRDLADQAIENTLDDHQLPASDRDAALSWAP